MTVTPIGRSALTADRKRTPLNPHAAIDQEVEALEAQDEKLYGHLIALEDTVGDLTRAVAVQGALLHRVIDPGQDEAFLELAVEASIVVRFTYQDGHGKVTDREVSPFDVLDTPNPGQPVQPSFDSPGFLFGFDHTRGEKRMFRLDRISELVPCDESFVDPEDVELP